MDDIIHKPTRSEFKRMAVQLGYEQVVRCDVCCMRGENCKANGWCSSFWPGKVRKNA